MVCVMPFVVVFVVAIFYPPTSFYRLYTGGRDGYSFPFVINGIKNCYTNFAKFDIGYIRSKGGTVQL